MFVEQKSETRKGISSWLETRARRYPGVFTAALILLAVAVTLGLLLKTSTAAVLYQGF